MRRPLRSLLRALSVLLALALPAALTWQLVEAAATPAQRLESGLLGGQLLLAQADGGTATGPQSARAAAGAGADLVTGVLYTRGRGSVLWNDVEIPIENGSYAYVGGEMVRIQPASMGVLRLPDGSRVTHCAGSLASLQRVPRGGYALGVERGTIRISVADGTPFSARARDVLVTPVGPGDGPWEAEIVSRADGSVLACELRREIRVAVDGRVEPATAGRVAGRVVTVPAAVSTDGRPAPVSLPLPDSVLRQVRAAAADESGRFLCRCEELAREAERAAEERTRSARAPDAPAPTEGQAGDAAPDSAPLSAAPTTGEGAPGDEEVPPVAPPDVAPLALAEPGPPDPFDPNVLPPPAAGEPAAPVVTVAPPAVPFNGPGGAGGLPPLDPSGGGPQATPS